MEQLSSKHFTRTLSSIGTSPSRQNAMEIFLVHIPIRVFANKLLNLLIDLAELLFELGSLANNKSSGSDGFPAEFYEAEWSWLGKDYLHMIQAALCSEQLPLEVNRGAIIMLHKKGNHTVLSNKRGITLMNTSYKIFAKLLALRVALVLSCIITPKQNAFLQGRFILDNITLLKELQRWARDSAQPMAILSIDYFKAFDMVEWDFAQDFVLAIMDKLGFGKDFCRMTKLLLIEASAEVIVNNKLSPSLRVTRLVRQGCPFMPLLFLLITNALSYKLEDA